MEKKISITSLHFRACTTVFQLFSGIFVVLTHFDVICDLFLNRRRATWNLFVKLGPVARSMVGTNDWFRSIKPKPCFGPDIYHSILSPLLQGFQEIASRRRSFLLIDWRRQLKAESFRRKV